MWSGPTPQQAAGQSKPGWLRQRAPQGPRYEYLRDNLQELKLNTVCVEAQCPNVGECWNGSTGTATIMLLGELSHQHHCTVMCALPSDTKHLQACCQAGLKLSTIHLQL